ncbi:transglutaminase-like domain-containing protein [Derxia gummosa]|uniref:Transglutaminase-like domain-containing protein n=1 Tax=Derxia gummosa DSM 723 TaxID=1121388 RepID=A0A8B6XBU3_9BURK|nr:transglutaminase family protein [Derxia gummosa]
MTEFELQLGLDYEVADKATLILNIAPARTAAQIVTGESLSLFGAEHSDWYTDRLNANRFLRINAGKGELSIEYACRIALAADFTPIEQLGERSVADLPVDTVRFLLPSRYCQSDRLGEFAQAEFGKLPPGHVRVMAVRDWVRKHVRFQSGFTNPSTSAVDTLVDRRGVCRDFAHLMIGLCRALSIPARFVAGIDYSDGPRDDPMDFHAYVECWLGERWYLFDPTGLCAVTDLIRIGTGRDAADVAFASIFGAVKCAAPRVEMRRVAGTTPVPLPPTHGASTSIHALGDLGQDVEAARPVRLMPGAIAA